MSAPGLPSIEVTSAAPPNTTTRSNMTGIVPNGDGKVPFEPTEHPHRRFNPLIGKHVLVSPHRTKRPWKGQTEGPQKDRYPPYVPECYLCPGNSRTGGDVNPKYEDTFTFPNDFPALLTDPLSAPPQSQPLSNGQAPSSNDGISSIFDSEPVRGRCKVICFHPRHDLTLARMSEGEVVSVIEEWKRVYTEEGAFLRETSEGKEEGEEEGHVQIFENRGAMMGASAPHPHGQVWSLSYVPDEPATELYHLEKHAATKSCPPGHPCGANGKACLLCSYATEEVARAERVVEIVGGWVAVVPFWAVWPYELLVLPYKRHIPSILQMDAEETRDLALLLRKVLVRYDNLFSCPFPYSMGLHQAPLPPKNPETHAAHTHFHFYPPLLRSASVRKFLVGFEMMGEVQRDLTAEQAAARLRQLDDTHYSLIPTPWATPKGSPKLHAMSGPNLTV